MPSPNRSATDIDIVFRLLSAVERLRLLRRRFSDPKSEPLGRALNRAAAWITGLGVNQSAARSTTPFVAYDPAHDLLKANPLHDWTRERTVEFAPAQDSPVNPLHHRGFLSIGCAPYTRAIAPGEAERVAGRWWWDEDETRECGLNLKSGRLVRAGA